MADGAKEENSRITFTAYAAFEDYLQTDPNDGWRIRIRELVDSGTGFLDKDRATYRHATAAATDMVPDVSHEILAAVRGMRSRI